MRYLVCSIAVLSLATLAIPARASSPDDKMIDQQTISFFATVTYLRIDRAHVAQR